MYLRNRSFVDRVGLSVSFTLFIYLGGLSFALLLWDEIKYNPVAKVIAVISNALVSISFLLFLNVSSVRGYAKEEGYISGGRFCYECRQVKAERVHHCSKCKKCIKKMDHHCPWIGGCVNGNNFGNFTKLLLLLFLSGVFHLSMYGYISQKRLKVCMGACVPSISSFIICANAVGILFILIFILVLFVRQMKLILDNLTYLETLQVKRFEKLGGVPPANPYDKGKKENAKEVFGTLKEFLFCLTPRTTNEYNYKTYWPPLKLQKASLP